MDVVAMIAEEKIREAIKNGELENLPGEGKPLKIQDLSHVPAELRAGYILLKNAGVLPEELELRKEIISLQTLVDCCYDEEDRKSLKRELNAKILRFNILMEKRKGSGSALGLYKDKIYNKLG
ncbi:DnaJ family domain-containing protein [Thermincola potens]|uniref:DnaJ-like, subfamily C, member 28, conserved domain protein n=1 Tax=Thermincola potens (strain JR) TaxID=635013 RepID=D5XB50_THEPJ|nr:DnaJ family domain-containing protein [Thermincola potens]ADG81370.1 DnaJ-like, subfamily C, member 28, conserved domain protein [Thermincola potens JR]